MTSKSSPSGNKRRIFLINPKFQLFFMGCMGLLAALILVTVYAANFYFFWKFQKYGEEMKLTSDHVFYTFLGHQRVVMDKVFGMTAGVVCGIIGTLGLVISHRIAGPMYRMTQHFKENLSSGTYRPLRFRKRDFFVEVADAYNAQLPASKGPTKAA